MSTIVGTGPPTDLAPVFGIPRGLSAFRTRSRFEAPETKERRKNRIVSSLPVIRSEPRSRSPNDRSPSPMMDPENPAQAQHKARNGTNHVLSDWHYNQCQIAKLTGFQFGDFRYAVFLHCDSGNPNSAFSLIICSVTTGATHSKCCFL